VLIPLGTDRPIRRPSAVTPALVLLTIAAYVGQAYARSQGVEQDLLNRFAVQSGDGFALYRTITYAFLHGDIWHIGGNMLFLWVFGRPVEDRLGRLGFLGLYLAGSVASGLGQVWLDGNPAIGASGAVSAVTGAFLVLFPKTRIRVLWFLILITMMMAPAWFFIGLQIAWNIFASVSGSVGNVATAAHLAGYAFGFAVAFTLLVTGVLPREPYDLFSISKHAKRRREFQAAGRMADRTMVARPAARKQPKPKPLDEHSEAVAEARAAVSSALSRNAMDEAVDAYRTLIEKHSASRPAVTLARNAQYRIGTHLASKGDNQLAMRAFDDFLGAYPSDPESPQIRVLVARMCVAIGATGRARRLLAEAIETSKDDDLKALAEAELAELGGSVPVPADGDAGSQTGSDTGGDAR
jgi:membrane associated rhomboid family serine protease